MAVFQMNQVYYHGFWFFQFWNSDGAIPAFLNTSRCLSAIILLWKLSLLDRVYSIIQEPDVFSIKILLRPSASLLYLTLQICKFKNSYSMPKSVRMEGILEWESLYLAIFRASSQVSWFNSLYCSKTFCKSVFELAVRSEVSPFFPFFESIYFFFVVWQFTSIFSFYLVLY